jgi:hypothetical protein
MAPCTQTPAHPGPQSGSRKSPPGNTFQIRAEAVGRWWGVTWQALLKVFPPETHVLVWDAEENKIGLGRNGYWHRGPLRTSGYQPGPQPNAWIFFFFFLVGQGFEFRASRFKASTLLLEPPLQSIGLLLFLPSLSLFPKYSSLLNTSLEFLFFCLALCSFFIIWVLVPN